MNTKIEGINKKIDKSKSKIADEQARLKDLEKQKTELENLEIVEAVRSMDISFTELAALLKSVKGQADPTREEADTE